MTRKISGEEIRECTLIGAAILGAQKVEFALYGAITHLKVLPQSQDKRLRNMNPEKFLRGNVKDLKVTLGQLVKSFGDELLLTTDELNQFVEDRNLIAHDYWRLTKPRIKEGERLEDPKEFLIQFADKCGHWEKVLRGLIALMRRETAKKSGTEINLGKDELICIKYYEVNAADHWAQRKRRSTTPIQ